MNQKILKKLFLSLLFALIIFAFFPRSVHSDAWWGKGHRKPEWVLAHGGTMIYFKIEGGGSKEGYKAVLEKDGKYVEGEIGKTGKFDDAKNGLYEITAYKGGTDDRSKKGGKKIASLSVQARPGETINLFFSEKTKTAFLSKTKSLSLPANRQKTEKIAGVATVAKKIPALEPVFEKPAKPESIPREISSEKLFTPVFPELSLNSCYAFPNFEMPKKNELTFKEVSQHQ